MNGLYSCNREFRPESWGAVGDGVTDDTAALQSAIDAADKCGGGIVWLCDGKTYMNATTLDFSSRKKVSIFGKVNRQGLASEIPASPVLLYTGAGAKGYNLASASNIRFHNVEIRYNNPAFKGELIDCDRTGAVDTAYIRFEDCSIGSTISSVTGARSNLRLNTAIDVEVRRTSFEYAQVGIRGTDKGALGAGYSNHVLVEQCVFRDHITHIMNTGQAWLISNNNFEGNLPMNARTSHAIEHETSYAAKGVTIIGNWFGDGSNGPTFWCSIYGYGFQIIGNFFGGTSGGGVKIHAQAQQIVIQGNVFETMFPIDADGIVFGTTIISNFYLAGVIPIPPASVTNYFTLGGLAIISDGAIGDGVSHHFFGRAQFYTGPHILPTMGPPGTSSDSGIQGEIRFDTEADGRTQYIYICTATNTWKRVAISTW